MANGNRWVGWTGMAVGIAMGLLLGMWSFDGPLPVPGWVGDYGDTSRRLLRLGHIAFVALGALNVLLARELPTLRLEEPARRAAARLLAVGGLLLPVTLVAAAWLPPVKYFMSIPALCVFAALTLAAWGTRPRGASHGSTGD